MGTHSQVPRSSKVVAEDNDYVLVTVVLFKRVVDEFKASARVKGYQVRVFKQRCACMHTYACKIGVP